MLIITSIIAILTCFSCAFLSLKDKLSPQFLFCGFIGIITFFASLPGFPQANEMTYFLIIFGIFFYTIGCGLGTHLIHNKSVKTRVLRPKIITILVIVLLTWSLYRTVTVAVPLLMMGQPLDTVRMVYFGEEYAGFSYRPIDAIVETYINQPFLYALIPITSIEMMKKKDERMIPLSSLILLLVWIALSCAISGGRMLIFCLVVVIGVTFLFQKGRIRRLKINKNKAALIIPVFVIGTLVYIMYLLSINRNADGDSYDFVRSIYNYFCGCVPHTALRLEKETIDYTYGMTLLQGVLRPFALVYKYTIGGGAFPELYQKAIDIAFVLQDEVEIGNFTFNAYALPFYFFYFDGGFVAVIIDSVLYGMFCGATYKKVKTQKTDISLAKYLIVVIYIFTSMVRFSPYIAYFALSYFYIDFLYKRKSAGKG